MARARRGPLQKVGDAADRINILASGFMKNGINVTVVSTDPLTVNAKIGDKTLTTADKKSLAELLVAGVKLLSQVSKVKK